MTKVASSYAGIEVVPLKVKYPQGGEKQLIDAITKRQVARDVYKRQVHVSDSNLY